MAWGIVPAAFAAEFPPKPYEIPNAKIGREKIAKDLFDFFGAFREVIVTHSPLYSQHSF